MKAKAGAQSKATRGGARSGAGRPNDVDLERLVVDLCESLGYQGDARVNPDQIIDGKVSRGQPWSREEDRGVRPDSVRDAARMVARRHLADKPLEPRARERAERSLSERIRRAYNRASKRPVGNEPWREIAIGPANGVASVAQVEVGDDDELDFLEARDS
ncbi:MAG: hypothetical protein JWM82_1836 [Myxococcales bacterium]|nr:hypothetical protein [Myxococcales bacterium]